MTTSAARAFSNQIVHLDGSVFIDCEFKSVRLVYSGGELPKFTGCHFQDCVWTFDAHARRTVEYLRLLVAESEAHKAGVLREMGLTNTRIEG